jgi:hypothetical protein
MSHVHGARTVFLRHLRGLLQQRNDRKLSHGGSNGRNSAQDIVVASENFVSGAAFVPECRAPWSRWFRMRNSRTFAEECERLATFSHVGRNGIARVIAEDAGEVRVLPRLRFRPAQLSTQSRP